MPELFQVDSISEQSEKVQKKKKLMESEAKVKMVAQMMGVLVVSESP